MDEADILIFTTPVYVYHATASMKAFLDHYGYRWIVHRPEQKMFSKQAVCISTAAGAGMKWANKDIADSLSFWGIPKIYKYGVAVRSISYKKISTKTKEKIDKETTHLANKIKKRQGKVKPGIKAKWFFNSMKRVMDGRWNEADALYWKEKGWLGKGRPWK